MECEWRVGKEGWEHAHLTIRRERRQKKDERKIEKEPTQRRSKSMNEPLLGSQSVCFGSFSSGHFFFFSLFVFLFSAAAAAATRSEAG